jgi:hypothetical protein
MSLDQAKYELLSKSGYQNHFKRSLYYNRQNMKIFSLEAIEDHDINWLQHMIQTPNDTKNWLFYFSGPISQSIMNDIIKVFEK